MLGTKIAQVALANAFSIPRISSDIALYKLSATDAHLLEGFSSFAAHVSTTGRLQATMILVDFPDAIANNTTESLYDNSVPGASEWYATASYGKLELDIIASLSSFYRMPSASDTYGFERGLTVKTHLRYIMDALTAVASK